MFHSYLITVPGFEHRADPTVEHLRQSGLLAVSWFNRFMGINGTVAGLSCTNAHLLPDGSVYTPTPAHTSLCLNHWFLWQRIKDAHWADTPHYSLILEDDVRLVDGWYDKLVRALEDVPDDWDLLFIGSCYARHHGAVHVKGDVWKTEKPNCTHAYFVRHKALPVLLNKCQRIYTNIDWALVEQAIPHLKSFAILPRIAHQFTMENLAE